MPLKIVRRLLPPWGTTYGPPGDGPFPAIMVLHGSEGAWSGWSHRNAAILAAHGFLAFPFPYSKGGNFWNAGNITDAPLDQTVSALNALRDLACVGPKIGIYGVSRGAEHALLLASLMARDGVGGLPDALAAHSPPDVVCGASNAAAWRDTGDPGWQAWDPGKRAWTWRGSSEGLLPTTPIEIERFDGPIFLSHGTADRVWSVDMTRRLEKRLKHHGHAPEVHYYEGEDHIPGSAAENEHYEQVIAFFERHLMT
ncbi:alpha/beta hydrolase family protein [Microvirga alba]|uniref:Prolyl oligopeptidase family serine peptidase n=1 Tax=Microvirga alba TaxID=2791025 RepID=A0A931FQK5_9HYPH|nr:acyl-CoA thioester hydrolase/BAAT C-terminal domain-containing protein [Microvirga alba]MBF9231876.1 prolyl oligopeptidase family serine peptidase [Microvirga alba]